jgi:hypothetical protein
VLLLTRLLTRLRLLSAGARSMRVRLHQQATPPPAVSTDTPADTPAVTPADTLSVSRRTLNACAPASAGPYTDKFVALNI